MIRTKTKIDPEVVVEITEQGVNKINELRRKRKLSALSGKYIQEDLEKKVNKPFRSGR